ncbi:N-6 DNA methylase [Halobacteriaceae archaeon SHR40]|uniref:HsdM family class I SAM-dependent methyltransferase n=1 Tax=Halovenus amylolytica TaxID=2500550 RepID=UPI000FE2F06B
MSAAASQLFEPLLEWSADESAVDIVDSPDQSDTLLLRSDSADFLLVGTTVDTDPHTPDLVQRAHSRAREYDAELFATANANDLFVFRTDGSRTAPADLDRRHYDLHDSALDTVVPAVLDESVAGDGWKTEPFEAFLLGRLQSFHWSLVSVYQDRIETRIHSDEQFQNLFAAWAHDNQYPSELPDVTRTVRIAAKQYAYLRINRILCYELLRQVDGSLDPLIEGCPPSRIDDQFADQFESAVTEYGYDAIFRIDSVFLQAIPDDERTRCRWHSFIESLGREPIGSADPDILRRLYEQLHSQSERDSLGQFYTPEKIGTILAGWAIQSAEDRVLDPCSGPGALTVPASRRLGELGPASDSAPADGVTAVDIQAFPLQLTALNLRLRTTGSSATGLSTANADFFDLDPGTDPDTPQSVDRRVGFDGASGSTTLGRFDATVANPPYVRQEDISAQRAHFRAHLAAFDPDASSTAGAPLLDRRSDLYCYFLSHATQFLDEGGRLAWIVPTKWLTADYGPSFQQFLFDRYSVEAVVGFPTRLFEDALVDTVLLLAERRESESERLATNTNFVRLTEPCSPDTVLEIINSDYEIPDDSSLTVETTPESRTVVVRQSTLVERLGQKLQPYLTAPALYLALSERDDVCSLSELATITRGVKTGANPIFVLDGATIETHGIDDRFCRPAIKSVRAVDGFEYTASDAERWLLDLGGYVTSLDVDDPTATAVRAALREEGYDGVCSYLSWAADQPARKNSSLEANEPWFDMGSLAGETAPIVCPQAMDTRRFLFRTDCAVVPSNRFLLVDPAPTVDETLLLGLLNSSLSQIVVESHGRVTGGGAINLSGSDLETFCVPDPEILSAEQAAAITEGVERLADGDQSGRDGIDRAVIEALDLGVAVAELQELSQALKRIRRVDEPPEYDIATVESTLELTFE